MKTCDRNCIIKTPWTTLQFLHNIFCHVFSLRRVFQRAASSNRTCFLLSMNSAVALRPTFVTGILQGLRWWWKTAPTESTESSFPKVSHRIRDGDVIQSAVPIEGTWLHCLFWHACCGSFHQSDTELIMPFRHFQQLRSTTFVTRASAVGPSATQICAFPCDCCFQCCSEFGESYESPRRTRQTRCSSKFPFVLKLSKILVTDEIWNSKADRIATCTTVVESLNSTTGVCQTADPQSSLSTGPLATDR